MSAPQDKFEKLSTVVVIALLAGAIGGLGGRYLDNERRYAQIERLAEHNKTEQFRMMGVMAEQNSQILRLRGEVQELHHELNWGAKTSQ